MEALRKVVEILQKPGALAQRLQESEVQGGLRQLEAILETAVHGESRGLRKWSKQQLDFVLAVVDAVVCATCDIVPDGGESDVVEQIYRLVVQLCIRALEDCFSKSGSADAVSLDEEAQQKLLLVLETAIVEGKASHRGSSTLISLEEVSTEIPPFDLGLEVDRRSSLAATPRENKEAGASGLQGLVLSENILDLLANEQFFVPNNDGAPEGLLAAVLLNPGASVVATTKHYAVIQLKCMTCFLSLCTTILTTCQNVESDEEERVLRGRVTLVCSILTFLGELSRACGMNHPEEEFIQNVIELAAALPVFYQLTYDYSSSELDFMVENSLGSSLPGVIDEFFQLAVTLRDPNLFLNLRTYITTSILDLLRGGRARHDGSFVSPQSTLACTPHVISRLVGLFHEVYDHSHGALQVTAGSGRISENARGSSSRSPLMCQLRGQNFDLNEARAKDEHLRVLFSEDGRWVDNLVSATALLHAQGLKEGSIVDSASSVQSEEDSAVGSVDSVTVASEDDALFGDLFSESGRHSVNSEGNAQTSSSAKKLDGLYNTPLQATHQVMSFLKDGIFSPEWHQPIFKVACNHLSKEHLDVFLQIHFSKFSIAGRHSSSHELVDLEVSSDLLTQLQKGSFALIQALVIRQALSENLETHLANQILKEGDSGGVLSSDILLLLARLLINRHQRRSGRESDDPVVFMLWKNFVDSLVSKAKGKLVEVSFGKISESLPSVLHMEVLFMAFHSVSTAGRLNLFRGLLTALKSLRGSEKQPHGSSSLAGWSLVVSRLVLAIRYVVLHFNNFPKWVLVHMRNRLRLEAADGIGTVFEDDIPTRSWPAILGRCIADEQSSMEQHVSSDTCFEQLFDVSDFCVTGWVKYEGLSDSDLELGELRNLFDDLLEIWRDKTFGSVEELLVERYIFLLSWSSLQTEGTTLRPEVPWDMDSSRNNFGAGFLRGVGRGVQLIMYQNVILDVGMWTSFMLSTLANMEKKLSESPINLQSWDFLRHNASLNLLLSLLQAGLCGFTQRDRSGPRTNYDVPVGKKDGGLLPFLEDSVGLLVRDGTINHVLKYAASLLRLYVDAFRSSVVAVVSENSSSGNTSCFGLLFQGVLSGSKQQHLLESVGVNVGTVQALLRRGSCVTWQAEVIGLLLGPFHDGRSFKDINNIFVPALLHGFPLSSHPGSAAVASSTLCLESLLDVVERILSLQAIDESLALDISHLQDILSTVMHVSLNSSLENIRGKCIPILDYLLPSKVEQASCADLFLLRHVEDLLRSLTEMNDVDEVIREGIIVEAINAVNNLRMDATRSRVLKSFYFPGQDSKGTIEKEETEKGGRLINIGSLGLSGSLSPFIHVLNGCSNETVNQKVLQLLLNFLGGDSSTQLEFKLGLQKKFMSMDTNDLAAWLEFCLLGNTGSLNEGSLRTSTSAAVRELASKFLQSLVNPTADGHEQGLRSHLVTAMLVNLERAFVRHEMAPAKEYFGLLTQLAVGKFLLKQVLTSVGNLVERLTAVGDRFEGLKSILAYLNSILVACGAQRMLTQSSFSERHRASSTSSRNAGGAGQGRAKTTALKKNSEQLLPTAMSTRAPGVDCDAASVDEDEDDATSDGELASLDREEEEDGANSERALASKVCTFTSSGSNFMEQHWYFCYTCDLTASKGCCSICARVCHRGHRVVYSRLSRFFCDCGAVGVRGTSCLCLKPRKYVSPTNPVSATKASSAGEAFLPLTGHALVHSESDTDIEDDDHMDSEGSFKIDLSEREEREMLALLTDLNIEGKVLSLCEKLLAQLNIGQKAATRKDAEVLLGGEKIMTPKGDLLQLKRAYKSGSLDMKIKADYSNARDLKAQLANGAIVKSLLTISNRGRLAAGEGDRVTIFDVEQLIGQPTATAVTVDKTTVKPLSKNAVRFELVQLAFNNVNESYLAVAGYEDCLVFTVNTRGEVTDRLAVELALIDAHIRRVSWVPGSQVQLMVVTNRFLKIYDLSQDKISPTHYFTVLEDSIADACLVSKEHGQLVALVLSQQGVLYSQHVSAGGDSGSRILTENIQLPDCYRPVKGISLSYSAPYKLLFLSYSDNLTIIGRLNAELTDFVRVSNVLDADQDGKSRAAGLHHWKEIIEGSGLFAGLSGQKSSSAVAVLVGSSYMHVQQLRTSANASALRVDGIAAYRPVTKERNSVLILHDDGSLHVFSYVPSDTDSGNVVNSVAGPKQGSSFEADQMKKLGAVLVSSRTHSGVAPAFPLDFFEKTNCITADVRLGGDVLRNSDSEGVKSSLTSEDGFVEGTSAAGFKILVYNMNPEVVMVGCRVQVGNTSASHIPSEIRLFQRTIRLEEGVRSWYDIPFTDSEALLADEEFTLSVGPTFNGSSLPRIDSLDVYGRSKDDFGWKEKLDAVLDLESQGQAASSSLAGSSGRGTKNKLMQNASALEQVFADSFHLLHNYYLAHRSQIPAELEEASLQPCRAKCLPVLETVFESDRQPMLQSAARHVLCALFPVKDAYYQAEDLMRLSGVAHSCPSLAARISAGGSTSSMVIQEFSAQMRAVCKIALHRQSNLANYLDHNGSTLIDGLMNVLWEILTWEQLDAQSINNLVKPMVDLIYGYAECLVLHASTGISPTLSIAPAVALLHKLLFSPDEAVRTSCSLAISSTLLQVPLPKQTMLAMGDIAENSRAPSIPSDSGSGSGGGGQVMIDEDAGTASVQYCCDGCSIVPIARQRWHCNVCPDFDLCESCYEVMDADQLPPPHSRDHPMSAIPIENDLPGGDPGDMHFSSIDELSDESLLQMATELSLQSNGSPVSFNSVIESGEVALPTIPDEAKGVPISASRSEVNGLLLQGLMEKIQGWMRSSTGAQALPVMQLFYRLASAATGPLAEGSSHTGVLDLERLVKFLLQEMDLSTPLMVKSRTNVGEVMILTFLFFTLVLRNWHQPGSEQSTKPAAIGGSEALQATQQSSGAMGSNGSDAQVVGDGVSQLDRACAALRQQSLINYLLNIVQQLTHIFKNSRSPESSSTGATGAGCGSLLNVRREFASGSYAPFFSDSNAKAHRGDLFGDFHRLLLESVFRLTYNLVRPEKSEKGNDKEQVTYKASVITDLKLDGWQEVLCNFINNQQTTFIRRYARRLLLHLCGTKGHYYNVRDAWQLNREVKRLFKLAQKSGGFQIPVSYERSVKLVKCLTEIAEVAASRPRNWQKYCSKHIDILQFLLSGVFSFGEESVVQTLKLLMLVFYTGKDAGHLVKLPGLSESNESSGASSLTRTGSQSGDSKKKRSGVEDGLSIAGDKAYMDMEQAVDQLAADDGKILCNFIDCFLLEWNSASVRVEAKAVLHGAWNHGKQSFRLLMLRSLLERIPVLPSYGQNIVEYTDLLTWLLAKGAPDATVSSQEVAVVQGCVTEDVVKGIFGALCAQNELLANHPNSRIYTTLASLVEFDGYYLESEPCLACSSPELPYTKMKLESLKSETKFTDNRILVKCVGSHTIQSVTMNVHDGRRSKSVKVLNLYYNNRAVADLSELKNNWSLWRRARSCHLSFNQTELKVEFPIPITACNFMIELDSFYENLQASSLEALQCPRCSRYVTDKHGICSNCHENAYQCRQCRNINYENLDSFLCNECGYSKYGRFEFNFMAKPSFTFDSMENDDDMKKGLIAIEAESENAHRRYQQLLSFKKPLLKLVSSIGETELDSQQKDSVQQMIVSLPGSSSFKINRKIAILGVLYGEKCKMAFDSVSKSVQTLQGLRRVLMVYLERKRSAGQSGSSRPKHTARPTNRCFGCANTFVAQCLEWLQVLAKQPRCRQHLLTAGILRELFENNIHQGPKAARVQARTVLCTFTEGDAAAVSELNSLIRQKAMYCLEHHRSMDVAACVRDELQLLSESCSLADEFWETRFRVVFQLLFRSIQIGARHPVIAEHIILPCLRIVSQAWTPPKGELGTSESANSTGTHPPDAPQRSERQERAGELQHKSEAVLSSADSAKSSFDVQKDPTSNNGKLQSVVTEKDAEQDARAQDANRGNYVEWKNGSVYLDSARRQYVVSQLARSVSPKLRKDHRRGDFLALKYLLKWKKRAYKGSVSDELSAFEESSWVHELVLSACSQAIRLEMCALIEILCAQSPVRKAKFLNLLMNLLPSTRAAGESAAEYFDLLFKMVEPEDSRLFLTVRGFLRTACSLITEEVGRIEALEWSAHTDISQGYILHKLIELLGKFLLVPNIRTRFMKEDLLAQILQALLALRGLVVQKTKLTGDCDRLLRELLDGLLQESYENKRHFVRACTSGLQSHNREKMDRTSLFILEQLCDVICPTKPEQAYMMVLNKAHTQEEFIRGSMTKNPYSSLEVGPLMRDVKNKICHQLELIGLIEDDYGMELLVAGNIIALDLSVAQVYEQVWRKAHQQSSTSVIGSSILAGTAGGTPGRECPPMTVTYRLQGLDGEATEPMIKELEEDREESQDPEVEFAIAGVMRECGGLEIILSMVQKLSKAEIKASQEELALVLKLLMFCCKIRANRQALLSLGALGVLLEAARRAFSTDAAEPAEGLLLIVESLVSEANESDLGVSDSFTGSSSAGDGTGAQAASAVLMFLEKLSHPAAVNRSNKQQRNNETVARILPYLTYGEEAAMEVLVDHFIPYLRDWPAFDKLSKQHLENSKDEAHRAAQQKLALDNFVRVTESIKLNPNGHRLKTLIMEKGITTGAIRYLKGTFPTVGKGVEYRTTAEWVQGLEMPSVPIILSILRGLSRGHMETQQSLDKEGILPLLHALEGVSGDNEIGARAENLLDTLADKGTAGEGFLMHKVSTLRHATRDETRRRALLRREEVLSGLGMRREVRSDGGERIVVSKPQIEGLEEVEEEEAGLACMVCREGYKLRPTDMLGTYCYSKRINLALGLSSHVRAEWVYTTVSHFNVIHFQCHQEAKRADASLKNPKKEWEGATLRNNETLCNNLFPLRGPAVPLAQYARCVDQYWDNLNALGRADGSRLRLLVHDIVMMLARFATGSSFSVDSKGGGRESNSRLLPFMLQVARHLLDQGGASQRRAQAKTLSAYLTASSVDSPEPVGFKTPPPSSQRGGSADESVQFMMVQSLLLHSLEQWQHHRRTFLQRAAVHAYVQYKNGRSLLPTTSLPSPLSAARNSFHFTSNVASPEAKRSEESREEIRINLISGEQLFTVVQPMLVYVGLVDQMQQFFKRGNAKAREFVGEREDRKSSGGLSESTKDEGSVHCGVELWETNLKDRLRDVGAILGFAKDMLEWLEEMHGAQDIQEALDVMGALGDALNGTHKTCEDFIRDAIASSKFR